MCKRGRREGTRRQQEGRGREGEAGGPCTEESLIQVPLLPRCASAGTRSGALLHTRYEAKQGNGPGYQVHTKPSYQIGMMEGREGNESSKVVGFGEGSRLLVSGKIKTKKGL